MRIDVRRLATADVVQVCGPLDLATTPRLRAVLEARIAEGSAQIILDCAEVRLLSAGALGMLATLAGRAEQAGGRLRLVGVRGLSRDVLDVTGLASRLNMVDEPSELPAEVRLGPVVPAQECWHDGAGRSPSDTRWPGSRDITAHALIAAARRLPEDSTDREALRRQAIEDSIPFARRLARRFRDRGEPGEDLVQVAMVGLLHAIDGYDPARGGEFTGYALPTILGELRRYFRDKGWRIKVPRRMQELRLMVNRAEDELSQVQAGSPTVADIAAHLSIEEDEVEQAHAAARLYQPVSLSAPASGEADIALADPLGDEDPAMAAVDARESVRPLLAALPERERAILTMRFFGEMTQAQIADELGISQMHVSRLLTRTLGSLRAALVEAA
jgi:RNA polymerase sigma-B factor